MGVQCYIYRFSKQRDSTATPSAYPALATLVYDVDVVFKQPTSIINPVLIVDLPMSPTPPDINYLRLNMGPSSRWYFVDDIVSISSTIWELHCSSDVMGNARNTILSSTQFVERSEVQNNPDISDALALGSATYTTSRISVDSPWRDNNINIICEIAGNGGSEYYRFSISAFYDFLDEIFSDSYVETILPNFQDIAPEIKSQLNPLQYITSVRAYPLTQGGIARDTIGVGYGITHPTAYYVPVLGSSRQITTTITCPTHPQSGNMSYLNTSPYTTLQLYYPPFGTIPLDPALCAGRELTCTLRIDYATGNGLLTVFCGSPSVIVGSAQAKIGVDMALGQVVSTAYGGINAAMQTTSQIVDILSFDLLSAESKISNSLMQKIGSLVPEIHVVGSNSGWAGFSGEVAICGKFQAIVPPSNRHVGRPLYADVEMSQILGGFCKCINAEIQQGSLTRGEADKVQNIMNGGFYLV